MTKRVILITGTPTVGKTTLAKKLVEQLNAQYVNLTELSKTEHLALREDKERSTTIIDEDKMRRNLKKLITKTEDIIVIDGHYAAAVTPKALVTNVFVLRRHPVELRGFMQKRGYNQSKQNENIAAEILDICLMETLQKQEHGKVCELDVTGKTVDDTLREVCHVLEGKRKCFVGSVDWIGTLEREGVLDEYLKD
jgi:adenylate kinase